MAGVSESVVVVNTKASPDAVQAAVDRLVLPEGVRWTSVDGDAPEYLGYQTEVWLHGPDADERDADYAQALSKELGVPVLTNAELESAMMRAAAAAHS